MFLLPMKPVASVILCARNEERNLEVQLDALESQQTDLPWELIVVDNGSTDRTAEIVEGWLVRHPSIDGRLIDGSQSPGLSAARNIGIAQARGEYLLFCDADDLAHEDWVRLSCAALVKSPMIAGQIELDRLNTDPDWKIARRAFLPSRLPAPLNNTYLYAVGANMGIRVDLARRLGGFDQSLMICWDDIDMSIRVQDAGFDLGSSEGIMHYRLRTGIRSVGRQFANYGRGSYLISAKYTHTVPPRSRRESFDELRSGIRGCISSKRSTRYTGVQRLAYCWGSIFGP